MSLATSAVLRSKYDAVSSGSSGRLGIGVGEVEELHLGRDVEGEALLAGPVEVALEHLAGVALERRAVEVGDVAEHAGRRRLVDAPRQQLEAVGVGEGEHVALLHPAEAVDGRAVELHPLGEGGFELGGGGLDRLQLAEHVGEPQAECGAPRAPRPYAGRSPVGVPSPEHVDMVGGRDPPAVLSVSHTVHIWATTRQRAPSKLPPKPGPRPRNPMTYLAEYIWIDGTEPTAKLRSKTKVLDGQARVQARRPAHLGLRRLEHQPGPRQQLGLCAAAGVRLPRPDPRRRQHPRAVRGAAHRHEPARHQHPGPAAAGGREVRRAGVAVRHRAGVHVLRRQPSARLPRGRLPRSPGRLLLRRRRRRDLRSPRRREAPRELPQGRPRDLGHQRRGHARPVGVPSRPGRAARRVRSAVGGPLAALPHGGGVRRVRHAVAQAGDG